MIEIVKHTVVKYRLRRCEVMLCIVKFCAIAQSEVKCATHLRSKLHCVATSRCEAPLHVPQGTLSWKQKALLSQCFLFSGCTPRKYKPLINLWFSEASALPMWSYAVGIVKFCAIAQSEVKFAHKHLRNKLHYEVTSLPKATSLARKGKLSFQKQKHFLRSAFVFGGTAQIWTGE